MPRRPATAAPPAPPHRSRRSPRRSPSRPARLAPARRRAARARQWQSGCEHERANALRSADLVGRKGDEVGAGAARVESILPAAWTASQCSNPPAACVRSAAARTGWTHTGLVIGGLEADEHPFALACAIIQPLSKRIQIDDRRSAEPECARSRSAGKRAPSSTQGCSMALVRSRSRGRFPAPAWRPGVRARTFASVPPLVKTTLRARRRPVRRRPPAPLDASARCTAFGMDRRRIAPAPAHRPWLRAPRAEAPKSRCGRDRCGLSPAWILGPPGCRETASCVRQGESAANACIRPRRLC